MNRPKPTQQLATLFCTPSLFLPRFASKLISAGRDRASAPSEIPLVMHGCHTTRTEKMQSWKEVCAEAENSILSECISSVAQGTENDYTKAGSKEPIPSEWNNKQWTTDSNQSSAMTQTSNTDTCCSTGIKVFSVYIMYRRQYNKLR